MKERRAIPLAAPGASVLPRTPQGDWVVLDGEEHYRIAAYDRLAPFLVSLPSASDLWMFVTSGGGLTAGRVDAEGALFPYVTVDRLHDAHHHTGPLTLIRLEDEGDDTPWEPFRDDDPHPDRERNLYKNVVGNRLVFEEVRHDLGLAFRYAWAPSDAFGWVRTAVLENRGGRPRRALILDGVRNVLPAGVPLGLAQTASNLVDAYKRSEVDPETGLGIFALTAGITDRAEALEVLRANTVWCRGMAGCRVHLSLAAVAAFRRGRVLPTQEVLAGERGNYLVSTACVLEPGAASRWHLAADSGRDHVQVADLRARLRADGDLVAEVDADLRRAREDLRRIVASADGLQRVGRQEASAHHFANVLFNVMRGGVFARNNDVPVADFDDFLAVRNVAAAARRRRLMGDLPAEVPAERLRAAAACSGDADLQRLALEYLPLFFGRRHGDPSRPWNRFSIHVRDAHGGRRLHHEGNWRDIFQNWEALGASFPAFLPHFVAKFVNASTVDGFNPYRVARDGVEWETVAPDDPWSNIGYWGDHQIVYLLRLLEMLHRYDPAALGDMLGAGIFSYADVPYRLKPYAEILRDPRDTIVFDAARDAAIAARVAERGTDGKLLTGADGGVHHANLLEKLLVPALSKLSNLVPGAGIWMNTQRPEWNDANNALGGGGVSVVTLCHLRRYLAFVAARLDEAGPEPLPVAREVVAWFEAVDEAFAGARDVLAQEGPAPAQRRRLMDRLGEAFGAYRATVYENGLGAGVGLAPARVAAFFRAALDWVDQGIAANRRDDGLYHTYNLLEATADGGFAVVRLPEMLEGQVAVLSAGVLSAAESLEVLRALFASDLHRADRRSFLLYPERTLPGFLARNAVPAEEAEAIPLLRGLLDAGDRSLLARDRDGVCRFHGAFGNGHDLEAALDALGADPRWEQAVARDRAAVADLFERTFRHRSYTGRSGVMYGYEGLGCVYWHMVAKLLLAVQETGRRAAREEAPAAVREGLARMYFRVRSGIGYEKTVAEYGAFPTDPYSHTPATGGAKQPGMTGQVKEEILTRWGELGVRVAGGAVRFAPTLLAADELLPEAGVFRYLDAGGSERTLPLAPDSLAFTFCQVPVVYERTADAAWLRVEFADGTTRSFAGNTLGDGIGADLFARNGRIDLIRVGLPAAVLRGAPADA